jgi:tetratricopeptide (TPR) repeat protein
MPSQLPPECHEAISRRSAEGDALARDKRFNEAIRKYEEAWNMLPDPKTDWEAATWLLAAIGDANFLSGRFDKSLEVFTLAITTSASGLGNPFLHLRRGESLFELGRQQESGDELMRAYMGAGAEIFKAEDPKYLNYLKTIAQLPGS